SCGAKSDHEPVGLDLLPHLGPLDRQQNPLGRAQESDRDRTDAHRQREERPDEELTGLSPRGCLKWTEPSESDDGQGRNRSSQERENPLVALFLAHKDYSP